MTYSYFVMLLTSVMMINVGCNQSKVNNSTNSSDGIGIVREYNKKKLMQIVGPEAPSDMYQFVKNNDSLSILLCSNHQVILSRILKNRRPADSVRVLGEFVLYWGRGTSENSMVIRDCRIYGWLVNFLYEVIYSDYIDTTCHLLKGEDIHSLSLHLAREISKSSNGDTSGIATFHIDIRKVCN